MTGEDHLPDEGQAKIELAAQVANLAAQVSVAMQKEEEDQRSALEAKLALAQDRLLQRGAPPGFIPFLEVMRGLLRGEDVSASVVELPTSYRAVYEQILDDLGRERQEGELTVREVLDEVIHNVILVLRRGTFDQRRQMADTLLIMEQESRKRPDLAALVSFLNAVRFLLKGRDPASVETRLEGPFREKWGRILEAIKE